MKFSKSIKIGTLSTLLLATAFSVAQAEKYEIESNHTYPSFEADHLGISLWRGKFDKTTGVVEFDAKNQTGNVNISVDMKSVNFGHSKMDEVARSEEIFNVAKFPTATYKGTLTNFVNGAPSKVDGELTMHGVSRPLQLEIVSFKCIQHPMFKREVCGADARGTFNRADFGITAGQKYGFDMKVDLRIQVEAVKALETAAPQ